ISRQRAQPKEPEVSDLDCPPDAIRTTSRNAHGAEVVSGFYAGAPDGRIVRVRSLKAGWRVATEADIEASAQKRDAMHAQERADAAASAHNQKERSRCHAEGEAERARQVPMLEHAKLKAAALRHGK
ncbi:MAG TPA: hypothetical protein VG963_12335, partial [Polyangiaceae bacterium]|nr:hypothetical protein [Polyangiaceae bacterium]